MAVHDFKTETLDFKVEVASADHQNKAEVGSSIAWRWHDLGKVDAIVDVPNPSVGLAGAGTSDPTAAKGTANTAHRTYAGRMPTTCRRPAAQPLAVHLFFRKAAMPSGHGDGAQDGP